LSPDEQQIHFEGVNRSLGNIQGHKEKTKLRRGVGGFRGLTVHLQLAEKSCKQPEGNRPIQGAAKVGGKARAGPPATSGNS